MAEQEAKKARLSSDVESHDLSETQVEHLRLLRQIELLDTNKYFQHVDPQIEVEYRKATQRPIFFPDVYEKIRSDGGYETHTEFIDDVERIFSNAIAFYGENKPELRAAFELRQDWESMLIESDLIDVHPDVYVSTDYEDSFEESDMSFESEEDFKSMEEKMLEEAAMPLTDVIDRYQKNGEAMPLHEAEIEELRDDSVDAQTSMVESGDDTKDSVDAEQR